MPGRPGGASRARRPDEQDPRELKERVGQLERDQWPEVGNRTALGRLNRSTWRTFCEEVERLPQTVEDLGFDRAHAMATGTLLGMLYTMAVTPPTTMDEARTRDDLRLMIVHRALFRQLSGRGRPYDRVRQIFLAATARVVLRPAVPAIFKRSPQDFFEADPMRGFGVVEDAR